MALVAVKLSILDIGLDIGRESQTKLDEVLSLFKPDSVLKWHRDLRRNWTLANDELGVDQLSVLMGRKGATCGTVPTRLRRSSIPNSELIEK